MLWHSHLLGPDERPAILALSATREGNLLIAECIYTGADVAPQVLPGTFIPAPAADGWPLSIEWPGLPWGGHFGRLHPNDKTPRALVIERDGIEYVQLRIIPKEPR